MDGNELPSRNAVAGVDILLAGLLDRGAESLCTAGMAGGFPCSNVDLLARVKMSTLGGTRRERHLGGGTDPTTGTEYAIMGFKQGTSFVDISTPTAPFVVGTLPPQQRSATGA